MYLRILKKDLKRKKTMNVILLIFIILAATFIASSVNNMVTVTTALDGYFERAEVPDYWIALAEEAEERRLEEFLEENQYTFRVQEIMQVDPNEIKVNGSQFAYSNTTNISTLNGATKIFNKNDEEISCVKEGEIYLTAEVFRSAKNDFQVGDSIEITANGKTRSFTLAGSMKDALFGSPMVGMTRCLVSEEDYQYFCKADGRGILYCVYIYTDDGDFANKLYDLELNSIMNISRQGIKTVYIMDMITAAVMLVVSICLILISMLILRFTIHFTMSEEFREIGVMKATGIRNAKIRGLYIAKYLAISLVGGSVGFIFSVPFGSLMMEQLEQNMIVPNDKYLYLNALCAVGVVAVVMLFCYFCTRKIKTFSPIDAIRNGENGERYRRKNLLSLSGIRIAPVPFMALNDILSDMKRYAVLILIFTIGLLLVDVPVNTINTIQSDHLITWFNMAECDHVISKETIFNSSNDNRKMVEDDLKEIKAVLSENGMEANVFEEIMFRMNISHGGKGMSSLAFEGVGDITAESYAYLEGTAPQNKNEVAISHIVAENIDAGIGDTVEIKDGEERKNYVVTAIYQSMNNMGEGIRFHQEEELDYRYMRGSFGVQIVYTDDPGAEELLARKEKLQELFADSKVYAAGEYINEMIGDVAGQLQEMKYLILMVVLCINILVTVLMVKSFITKEKGEIAIMKAMGFQNRSLIVWQALRIGLILLVSVIIGTVLNAPLSEITSGKIFQIMGAANIRFEIVAMEVYVIYPAVILIVTVLASMLAALQIRGISASETSNIE